MRDGRKVWLLKQSYVPSNKSPHTLPIGRTIKLARYLHTPAIIMPDLNGTILARYLSWHDTCIYNKHAKLDPPLYPYGRMRKGRSRLSLSNPTERILYINHLYTPPRRYNLITHLAEIT